MSFPATHPSLAEALAARGYNEPTQVQEAVLNASTEDNDLLVSAETGSGKTVAYGLALAPGLLGDAAKFGRAGTPLALVIAPTRELALQVQTELAWLYAGTGAKIITCVGGMDPRREQRNLQDGAHIVVGTPGRLRDHLERGQLDIGGLRALILDEADEMLDLGFRDDLEFILDSTPPARRTLLFSATLAKEIVSLARRYQKNAVRIDTAPKNKQHSDIEYRVMEVAPNDLEHAVVNTLRFYDPRAAIVFCSTRDGVRRLHANLVERGFGAVALSGELSQSDRTHAVQSLREGRARVCVATDVAARGLDLPDLALVIHNDLPTDRAILVHRSGRTGRAGRKGIAVVLTPYPKRRRAEQLLTAAGITAQWSGAPSVAEIRARDHERMLADTLLAEEITPEDLAAGTELLQGRSPEMLAALLVRLYRARLPAAEDLFDRPVRSPTATPRAPLRRGQFETPEPPAPGDEERPSFDDAVWFRMKIGRNQNADAKWLLPLICRLGHVTRKDIGAIRIFDRETKFAIARTASTHFETVLAGAENPEVEVERADQPDMAPRGDYKPRAPREGAPRDGASRDGALRGDGASREGRDAPREYAPRERSYAPRDSAPRNSAPRDGDAPRTPRPSRDGDAPRTYRAPRDNDAPRPSRDSDAPRTPRPPRDGDRPARAAAPYGERRSAPGSKPPYGDAPGKRVKHRPGAKSSRKKV